MPNPRGLRGRATLAAVLFLFLAPLMCMPCIGSMNLTGTQGHPELQLTPVTTRQDGSWRSATWAPPRCWQSNRPALYPENWREDSLVLSASIGTQPSRTEPLTPGSAHAPIQIWSDSDFAAQALTEGWPGNGTAVDPYIIEQLDIDATNTSNCILIYQTTVHFSIRHCFLTRAPWYGAIVLDHVVHSQLLNNTCTSNSNGIVILSSMLITVEGNNCSSNAYSGILVQDSTLTTLFNNTCLANGDFDIQMFYSRQNNVVNNTCSSLIGNIELFCSGDNVLANNSLSGGGLWLVGFTPFEGRQTLVAGNTVNAKPVLFWQDQVGGTLPSGFGQAVLVNCSQTTIRDTTVAGSFAGTTLCCCNETTIVNTTYSNNWYGLIMYACHGTFVLENAFYYSAYVGISIQNQSSNNLVGDNTCIGNTCGIELVGSGNTLWNNTCMGGYLGILVLAGSFNAINGSWITNNMLGIQLGPEANLNLIEMNIFTGIWQDAQDDSTIGNTFNWNYWSTYHGRDWDGNGIGDTPYLVPGDAHAQDYRPLMLPPGYPVTWLEVPQDQFFLYGDYIYYDLDATATPPGISQWWLSDTTLFTIDRYGVLTNRVALAAGTYWVQVWVSDWMGAVITAGFNIIVGSGTTTTTTTLQIPIIALLVGMVAVISTAAFVSVVGIVLLRGRRPTSLPPVEPFGDNRPPVDQWNVRCPLCGSRLFGDECFCPGCGNRVTKGRGG